jgi:chromosome segregation ATPase
MTIDERLERLTGIVEAHDRQIEVHDKQIEAHDKQIEMHDRRIEKIDGHIEKIVHIMEGFVEGMRRLEEAQARTEQRLEHFIQVTETRNLETTEKLNALIQVADDWIRNRPPGGPATQ